MKLESIKQLKSHKDAGVHHEPALKSINFNVKRQSK